eukprot:1425370-Alexandrium_andersonii.AAC.1
MPYSCRFKSHTKSPILTPCLWHHSAGGQICVSSWAAARRNATDTSRIMRKRPSLIARNEINLPATTAGVAA